MKSKWIVFIGVVICLFVLACALLVFTGNTTRMADYFESLLSAKTIDIDTMKTIFEIQKQASSSDVMAFLYTFFSTVLVGAGMYFLTKIQENAAIAQKRIDDSQVKVSVVENNLNKLLAKTQEDAKILQKGISDSEAKIAEIVRNSNDLVDKMNVTQVALEKEQQKVHALSEDIKNKFLVSSTIQHLSITEYYSFLLENFTTMYNGQTDNLIQNYIPKFRDKLKWFRSTLEEEIKLGKNLQVSELEIIHETLQSMSDRIQRYHMNLPDIFNDVLTEDLQERCQKCMDLLKTIS